jgi:hypothetical protein
MAPLPLPLPLAAKAAAAPNYEECLACQ